MSREDLELSKLDCEVESLKSQLDQAHQEKRKLELEVQLLLSQVGRFGTFARVAWPIVSVVLTAAIAVMGLIFTIRAGGVEAEHNERQEYISIKRNLWETYNSAVHDATEESKGNDGRISGVWVLNDPYFSWNNEYFHSTAHVLVGVLVTGGDDEDLRIASSKQAVRIAAAQVLGGPTPCIANHSGQQSPGEATARFLFGSVDNKQSPGIISSVELDLTSRRKQLKETGAVDLKLSAIRLVVQRYRDCFSWADLSGYDLRNVDLSAGNLAYAGLGASDMQGVNLRGTDLTRANLDGARVADILNWNTCVVAGANIKDLREAPNGFREWALNQHAVEMESSGWSSWRMKGFPEPLDWRKWRESGFAIRSDGVPLQ